VASVRARLRGSWLVSDPDGSGNVRVMANNGADECSGDGFDVAGVERPAGFGEDA
jgi:hypothetical protein